ncbi:DUF456 domain-containing protein [Desulfofundulus thermosubterraneus]|uniref:DUF456 domain-containing protein n=1 Tax=Desulfofundulus thermosubterraneus DSM 16057 TaxID=1121432 RepID=A0A1M6J4X9_9FIRM|nr:DUF456 domain-containing protein [Desulfofundulus thermosubterraneus]SHJ41760.1 hypothetical protein SAMN02745219_02509 [Desulfofundulus thermosubterraneus DSM 16057]
MSLLGLLMACLFFAAGLAGTVVPALPGAPLIWLGMLVYGLATGFSTLGWGFYLGQALAMALVLALDYLAGAWAVRRYGGSGYAIWGSAAGMILGLIVFGAAGIVFGPLVGAVIGELLARKPLTQAILAGWGSLVGLAGGMAVKLVLEIGMIVWFFTAIW